MKINNLQSHHRDMGHSLGPLDAPPLPHLWCMKSPEAPACSAGQSAWHPETQSKVTQRAKCQS